MTTPPNQDVTLDLDVAIVGLGPAGASAAHTIAAAGFSVCAFDKKRAAGTPVQCAEFIPLMLGAEVGAANQTTIQPILAMETFIEKAPADLTKDFRGRMIDRQAFDAALVTQAQVAGAKCCFTANIHGLDPEGSLLNGTNKINAKVIIGADGPRSRVGAAIGHSNLDVLETRQITVPLQQSHQATDIFLSDQYSGGYGWLFPKGKVANIGLGVDWQARGALKSLLANLHARLVQEGRVSTQILSHTGGAIPAGGMLNPAATLGQGKGKRLILLAGDAAGLTNCITGAGITSAVLSGNLAGEAAISWLQGNTGAMVDYREDLQDLFGGSLARACRHRQKLKNERAKSKPVPPTILRDSWIAYPQYWS